MNIWWTEQWPFQSKTRLAAIARGGVSAQGFARVPDGHLVERNPHGPGRVTAEVLVGEEQDAAAPGERPVEDGAGVGAGADDAAVPSAEGLEVGRRIDVGDRHHVVGVDDLGEVLPGGLDRFEVGHVGHAASGGQVGQVDLDLVAREDVGRLGHEVDAAKDDRAAGPALGGELAQLEAVSPEIGEPDHLVLLIMVSQDQERVAHLLLDREDPLLQLDVRQVAVRVQIAAARRRLTLASSCRGSSLR